jgi:hypothetical protein
MRCTSGEKVTGRRHLHFLCLCHGSDEYPVKNERDYSHLSGSLRLRLRGGGADNKRYYTLLGLDQGCDDAVSITSGCEYLAPI